TRPPSPTSTLSLHDALPIWNIPAKMAATPLTPKPAYPMKARPSLRRRACTQPNSAAATATTTNDQDSKVPPDCVCTSSAHSAARSEEHTSELQSRFDLVCRL